MKSLILICLLLASFSLIAEELTLFSCETGQGPLEVKRMSGGSIIINDEGKTEILFGDRVTLFDLDTFILGPEKIEFSQNGSIHNWEQTSPTSWSSSSVYSVIKESAAGDKITLKLDRKARRRMKKLKKDFKIDFVYESADGNESEERVNCSPNT